MRLVFAGTPEVAAVSLQALLDSPHEVCAVITRPDAPAGRGRRLVRSAVGELADEVGLPLLQPEHPKDPQFVSQLAEYEPDCVPVVAYGALVPAAARAVPRFGWVNLHFSLLPAWRGAAPVQHALLAGDTVTGATTFQLDRGMDTGPVLGVVTEQIHPRDTTGELLDRLAHSGAQLLVATIDGLQLGQLRPQPQPTHDVSMAPKLTASDFRIDWQQPAMRIDRVARAAAPTPGAWTTFRDQRLKLGPVVPLAAPDSGADAGAAGRIAPGEIVIAADRVLVGTLTQPVVLDQVQPQGKRQMAAGEWARGVRPTAGETLQ